VLANEHVHVVSLQDYGESVSCRANAGFNGFAPAGSQFRRYETLFLQLMQSVATRRHARSDELSPTADDEFAAVR
jgi:hypothetical protein